MSLSRAIKEEEKIVNFMKLELPVSHMLLLSSALDYPIFTSIRPSSNWNTQTLWWLALTMGLIS